MMAVSKVLGRFAIFAVIVSISLVYLPSFWVHVFILVDFYTPWVFIYIFICVYSIVILCNVFL